MAYEKFRNFIDEYNKSHADFRKKMKNSFEEIFTEFFNIVPEARAVVWNQYTPYFNDGEPCVFRVSEFNVVTDTNFDLDDIGNAYDAEAANIYQKPSDFTYRTRDKYPEHDAEIRHYEQAIETNPRYGKIADDIRELQNILGSIPNEIFLGSFDDHVTVIAKPEGIDVNEFSHD